MTIINNAFTDLAPPLPSIRPPRSVPAQDYEEAADAAPVRRGPDVEFLRRCAWEIGESRPADGYTPSVSHVGLAMVTPGEGFAHWRIQPEWVEQTARAKGDAWHHCRLVLRLYDVSYIEFNGLNAHRLQDETLPALTRRRFFKLPRAGTWQLGEVGFLLRSGEFIAAARSQAVAFAPESASGHGSHAGLLVNGRGQVEEVGNVWEQDRILSERRRPHLRHPLRLAAFAFASSVLGHEGSAARFVAELASGQCAQGHEVHVFVPACEALPETRAIDGVQYHPLDVGAIQSPLGLARAFARAAEEELAACPPFDLVHLHDWMTALGPLAGSCPTVLSLSSIEATRRNGGAATPLSLEIEETERVAARAAEQILTPPWLRDKAIAALGLEGERVRAFPMEGRVPNEWEAPQDHGQVKMGIGVGPLDRLLLFVGPLEHAAGPDLLLEALPVLLQRCGNLRLAFVGGGQQYGHLQHRAHQLGVAHAVRLLGHVEGHHLTKLLRAAEALVLPSRYRVPFDDAVVDLARRAGRPVVTTHGGPAHLVRHEENGVITYDNPGSMVWAMDRILGDPTHAERMGQNGRRGDGGAIAWGDVARHYLEFCANTFPELTATRW